MARKKISLLVQAINLFNSLSETDQSTLAEYVGSQLRVPRKAAAKKPTAPTTDSALVKQLRERTGAAVANCKAVTH